MNDLSGFHINKNIIRKFDRPGPRYTSYPTVPVWNQTVNESVYSAKLQQFGRSEKTLSIYVHLPFCESLCTYCGCNVVIRPREERYGDQYLEYLELEIDLVADRIGRKPNVKQLHWGGGTPTFLNEQQIIRLYQKLASRFQIDPQGEIAIEVDPRRVERSKLETLHQLGFNRISLGVQDFNVSVLENMNRFQSFETVARLYAWCRELRFHSVNFDLIYGLPGQSPDSFLETVSRVVTLAPDRVALYSFAYLPDLKKHQSKLSAEDLPDPEIKLDIFLKAREEFIKGGYAAIAMDHFALRDDDMAKAWRENRLHRNFMGYTVRPTDEFIGLGVTSIGFIEKTYAQNVKTLPQYYQIIAEGRLPVERGIVLSQDDEIRQYVIRELMCHFRIDKEAFHDIFHVSFDEYFQNETQHLKQCEKDALLMVSSRALRATELGKIFIRNVCMGFDYYWQEGRTRKTFSRTV